MKIKCKGTDPDYRNMGFGKAVVYEAALRQAWRETGTWGVKPAILL